MSSRPITRTSFTPIAVVAMLGATILFTRLNVLWWPDFLDIAPRGFPLTSTPLARDHWWRQLFNAVFAGAVILGLGLAIDRKAASRGARLKLIPLVLICFIAAVMTWFNFRLKRTGIIHGVRGLPFIWCYYTSAGARYNWAALIANASLAFASILIVSIWSRKASTFSARH